jgi:hypothetical protein
MCLRSGVFVIGLAPITWSLGLSAEDLEIASPAILPTLNCLLPTLFVNHFIQHPFFHGKSGYYNLPNAGDFYYNIH